MPTWGWFVIGGIPVVGTVLALIGRSWRRRDRGITPLSPGQVKTQKERLKHEQDRIRKDRDAAESAELDAWADSVRRRRAEANREGGSGSGDQGPD